MKVLENFIFFDKAISTGESNVLSNPNLGSQIIVQVGGTATAFEVQVLGQADINANFEPLSCINMGNFDVDNKITAAGIYAVPASGICKIKTIVNSVAGGAVTVFGKIGAD